mmetsp:Transcript_60059/g.196067  ORF Transcript_60059/g.196067 Transcript_60059/m.196067 type:complete len:229 (+) Transcript_60059:2583-3269(+)
MSPRAASSAAGSSWSGCSSRRRKGLPPLRRRRVMLRSLRRQWRRRSLRRQWLVRCLAGRRARRPGWARARCIAYTATCGSMALHRWRTTRRARSTRRTHRGKAKTARPWTARVASSSSHSSSTRNRSRRCSHSRSRSRRCSHSHSSSQRRQRSSRSRARSSTATAPNRGSRLSWAISSSGAASPSAAARLATWSSRRSSTRQGPRGSSACATRMPRPCRPAWSTGARR